MAIVPDLNECQPRFVLYVIDQNLRPGDEYKTYEYMIWVNGKSAEFKKLYKLHHTDTLTPILQEEFTKYIEQTIQHTEEHVSLAG